VSSGVAPLTVLLNDTSSGYPSSWQWSFGDGSGNVSTQNVTHTFQSAGAFNVVLTVTNGSQVSSASQQVIVSAAPIYPTAGFTVSPLSGNYPLLVSVTNMATNATAYNYSWGDSSANSTTAAPTHTYNAAGIFTIIQTVTNVNGSTSTSQTVTVNTAPTAGFVVSPLSGNYPLLVTVTNSATNATAYNYSWGDGSSNSTVAAPSHTYNSAGTFTITQYVTNANGSASTTQTVTVITPLVASFTNNTSSGVAPLTVLFNDTSGGYPASWQWNFGDNTGNVSTQNVTHTFASAGTFNVVLTVTNGSQVSCISEQITAYTPLVAGFTSNVTTGMAPLSVLFNDTSSGYPASWQWSFGDNTTNVSSQNVTHAFSAAGNYSVVLTVTNGSQISSSSRQINVTPATGPVEDLNTSQFYQNIQAAINAANSGDTILVNSGTYVQNVVINKTLSVLSNNTGSGLPVVDGSNGTAISITAPGVLLQGFKVTNATYGISVSSNNNNITWNVAYNNSYGIYLDNSSINSVSGNTANNNSNGIDLVTSSNNNNVTGNTAANSSSDGIVLSGSCNNNSVSGNTVNNSIYGIWLYYYSNNNNVSGNDVYNISMFSIFLESSSINNNVTGNTVEGSSYDGITLYSGNNSVSGNTVGNISRRAIIIYYSNNTTVSGNIANNSGYGVLIIGSGNSVTGNAFYSDGDGIYLNGSSNNVSWNTANNSSYEGILIWYANGNNFTWNNVSNSSVYNIQLTGSSDNLIYGNSFNGYGTANAITDNTSNQWNSTVPINYTYDGSNFSSLYGNYWSDYAGYDNNNDGIGDTPYISGNVTDYYPIVLVSLHSNISLVSMEYTTVTQPDTRNCEVWVMRSGLMNTTCSVNYTTVDGTGPGAAIAGTNYNAVNGTLIFQPNQTSQVIWVTLVNNLYQSQDRTFNVVLMNPINVSIVENTTNCVIDDNEPLGV
jgi:parallel beta-helix repeat protein